MVSYACRVEAVVRAGVREGGGDNHHPLDYGLVSEVNDVGWLV